MCGTHWRAVDRRHKNEPYDGATMRLDHVAEQRSERCHAGNFPWWTLWLIWPLMWTLSWIGPWLAERGGILLATAFIIAGLFLLFQPQREVGS